MNKKSTDEIIEIIFSAIEAEPFFSREVLMPKIKAIITAFRLDLSSQNYNKILTPSEHARVIRALEISNNEKEFWKSKIKNHVDDNILSEYYKQLNNSQL